MHIYIHIYIHVGTLIFLSSSISQTHSPPPPPPIHTAAANPNDFQWTATNFRRVSDFTICARRQGSLFNGNCRTNGYYCKWILVVQMDISDTQHWSSVVLLVWISDVIWMSHVTYMKESCHTYQEVILVTDMKWWRDVHLPLHDWNESCYTYEWVTSHIYRKWVKDVHLPLCYLNSSLNSSHI